MVLPIVSGCSVYNQSMGRSRILKMDASTFTKYTINWGAALIFLDKLRCENPSRILTLQTQYVLSFMNHIHQTERVNYLFFFKYGKRSSHLRYINVWLYMTLTQSCWLRYARITAKTCQQTMHVFLNSKGGSRPTGAASRE